MRETSIEVSGKTEDEAIQNALQQIGLDRDEVSVEIVERAKTGFLGIGSSLAVVKLTYMTDEPLPPEAEPAPVAVKPPPAEPVKPAVEFGQDSPAARANQFLIGLFERMDIPATAEIQAEEGLLRIELTGSNMGSVIGRRGEMLDAIQHLTNYVVNRGAAKRTRIHIDAESYRKKREDTLIRLANKVAEKVLRYRKNMGLEPMNSYERHVIHTALQEVVGVTTYSTGTEPNRRVFVAYDHASRPAPAPAAPTQTDKPQTETEKTHREWS